MDSDHTSTNTDPVTSQSVPLVPLRPSTVDSPLSMQITVHRLTGRNFLEWSQSVKLAIDGRGKLGYLTGEIVEPSPSEPSYSVWRSENSLIMAWLLKSMDVSIAKPHLFMHSAKDVWDSIRATYSDLENSSQIFELKTRLWQFKQEDRDITTYYNGMVALWQELDQCHDDVWESPVDCARQKKREENDRVFMFLAGVNRSLDDVKGRILGRKPLPSMRDVFSEVRMEENRKKIMCNASDGVRADSSALVVRGSDQRLEQRKKPFCDYCKRPWHTREQCWKLHGRPPNVKTRSDKTALHTSATTPSIPSPSMLTPVQIEQLLKLLPPASDSSPNPTCSMTTSGTSLPNSLLVSSLLCS